MAIYQPRQLPKVQREADTQMSTFVLGWFSLEGRKCRLGRITTKLPLAPWSEISAAAYEHRRKFTTQGNPRPYA